MKYSLKRSLFNTFIAFCIFFSSVFTPYYGIKKAFAALPLLGYAVGLVMSNKTVALSVAGLAALVGGTIYGLTSQVKDNQGNVYAEDIVATNKSAEAMAKMYDYVRVTAPGSIVVTDDGQLGFSRGYAIIGESMVAHEGEIDLRSELEFEFVGERVPKYEKTVKDACDKYANKLNKEYNEDLLKDGSLLDEVIKRTEAYNFICETCELTDVRDRNVVNKFFSGDFDFAKAIGDFYNCSLKGYRNNHLTSIANVAIKLSNEVLKCVDGYVPSSKEGEENTCILNDVTEAVADNKVNSKFDTSENSKGYLSNDKDKLAGKTSSSFDSDGGVTLSVGGENSYKQVQGTTSSGANINGYELEKPKQVVNVTPEYETVCPTDDYCYTKKTGDTMTIYEMKGDNELLVGTVYIDENGVIKNIELDQMDGYLYYEDSKNGKELVIYNLDDELEDVILTPNGSPIYAPKPVTDYNFPTNSGGSNGSVVGSSGSLDLTNVVTWGSTTTSGGTTIGGNTSSGDNKTGDVGSNNNVGNTTGGNSSSDNNKTGDVGSTNTGGNSSSVNNTSGGSSSSVDNNQGSNNSTQQGNNNQSQNQENSGNKDNQQTQTENNNKTENVNKDNQQTQTENDNKTENENKEDDKKEDEEKVTFPNDYALRVDVHETTAAVNKLNNTAENINENLEKLTKETEPPEPPNVDLNNAMSDYGSEFNDLLSWKLPPHKSQCSTPEFEVFGQVYNFDATCYIWEQNRDLIASFMSVFWVVLAMFIVLRS